MLAEGSSLLSSPRGTGGVFDGTAFSALDSWY